MTQKQEDFRKFQEEERNRGAIGFMGIYAHFRTKNLSQKCLSNAVTLIALPKSYAVDGLPPAQRARS